MILTRFNKQLIEALRKTIRFREPYGVFIDDTVKIYKFYNRDYKSLNNIDALGYTDFHATKNIFFYSDGSKPWENARHYTEYYETLHTFRKKYSDYQDCWK